MKKSIKILLIVCYLMMVFVIYFTSNTLSKYISTTDINSKFNLPNALYFEYTRGILYLNNNQIPGTSVVEENQKDYYIKVVSNQNPISTVKYYTLSDTIYTEAENLASFASGVDYYVQDNTLRYIKVVSNNLPASGTTYYTLSTSYNKVSNLTSFASGVDYYVNGKYIEISKRLEIQDISPADIIQFNFFVSNLASDDSESNGVDGYFVVTSYGQLRLPVRLQTYDINCTVAYRKVSGEGSTSIFSDFTNGSSLDLPVYDGTETKYEFQVTVIIDDQIESTDDEDYIDATLSIFLFVDATND